MMINGNYANIVAQAKANNQTYAHFDSKASAASSIKAQQDTVSLSNAALAKISGDDSYKETPPPSYIKPKTAQALLDANSAIRPETKAKDSDNQFADMMQSILDQRLGIDRKKLEELEAMMEEIAKNEDMSPEAKEQALEKLAEMRDKIIEESIEIKKVAKETFTNNQANDL